MEQNAKLSRTLTPLLLWGLGVGYVISGMYVGWNLGLEKGGTLGMAMATVASILMYSAFSFSYCELACAIPKAGGAFDYALRAFGTKMGFLTGLVQIVEFVFAPPAIALGIGAYLKVIFPDLPVQMAAIGLYVLFTALNIYGVKAAAAFELVVTVIAVAGLVLFACLTIPHVRLINLSRNHFPNGYAGAFGALPFAIWFFLGIEGLANVAEETINPQKDILKGFGWAILTLVFLCLLTFVASIGINGWEAVVYKSTGQTSDSPLPMAASFVISPDNFLFKVLVGMGIFGLIASFHGLILASGRATYEYGKVGYAPAFLGEISPRFRTPANALVGNSIIGISAILAGRTSEIIILSVFGALILYIVSMLAILRLRLTEPQLTRPFRVPFYPYTPLFALGLAIISLFAMIWYNILLSGIFFAFILSCFCLFLILQSKRARHDQKGNT